jgi:hypothetical protein
VDLALVAYGGRVNTGTWDEFSAPSADATYTNCYSFSVAGADRVVDRVNLNAFGNYTEFLNVGTPALCNTTPNSWCLSAGTVYINRADHAAVTNANTRLYRNATEALLLKAQKNIYVGAADADSGFDFEGCYNSGGVVTLLNTAPGATRNLAVFENCTFSQGGGAGNTTARAVSVESWNGVVAMFNCHATAAQTDLFNIHNTYASPTPPHLLLVNCTGIDAGRGANQSNNALTAHEDAVLIALGGQFDETRGGMVRCIGSSKTLLAGARLRNDRGDLALGGSFRPTAVSAADTAQIWCDSIDIDMAAGARAYCTEAAGAAVHRRNCAPAPQPDVGPGTFDTY